MATRRSLRTDWRRYPVDPQLTAPIVQELFDSMLDGDSLMLLPPAAGFKVAFLYNLDYCPPGTTH